MHYFTVYSWENKTFFVSGDTAPVPQMFTIFINAPFLTNYEDG